MVFSIMYVHMYVGLTHVYIDWILYTDHPPKDI